MWRGNPPLGGYEKTPQPQSSGPFVYILKQLCQLIPGHLVASLAKEHGVHAQSRTFTPWSHAVSRLFTQVTHAIGLNDVSDALRMNAGTLSTVRGATAPSRNNLSHANRVRDCRMAEALYWSVMAYLMNQTPSFAKGKVRRGYLLRFHKVIQALDSTTIQLVANCMDWAKHRRRKAAAKCHLRVEPTVFPAPVRHHRHGQVPRQPEGAGALRRAARGRNSGVRQGLLGLRASLRTHDAWPLVGLPGQG